MEYGGKEFVIENLINKQVSDIEIDEYEIIISFTDGSKLSTEAVGSEGSKLETRINLQVDMIL